MLSELGFKQVVEIGFLGKLPLHFAIEYEHELPMVKQLIARY
jgi:hypothetical protein